PRRGAHCEDSLKRAVRGGRAESVVTPLRVGEREVVPGDLEREAGREVVRRGGDEAERERALAEVADEEVAVPGLVRAGRAEDGVAAAGRLRDHIVAARLRHEDGVRRLDGGLLGA